MRFAVGATALMSALLDADQMLNSTPDNFDVAMCVIAIIHLGGTTQ